VVHLCNNQQLASTVLLYCGLYGLLCSIYLTKQARMCICTGLYSYMQLLR